MTFTIGRAGGDVTMREPKSVDFNGNQVSIKGDVIATSFADATALRQQLVGLAENVDEPVVPMVWSTDTHLTGFYRVNSVSVPSDIVSKQRYYFPYDLQLERVSQYGQPAFELTSVGTLRTNTAGIVNSDTVDFTAWQVSNYAWFSGYSATTFSSNPENRSLYNGSAATAFLIKSNPASSHVLTLGCAPAQWYEGGPKVELSYDSGSTWRIVNGRQIQNLAEYWRLSNDLVRCRVASPGSSMDLLVSHYDGSQWDTEKRYTLTIFGQSLASTWRAASVTVLRNDNIECVIRIAMLVGTNPWLIDLSLRRGSRFVEGYMSTGASGTCGVKVTTVEAATALTGGIRATSNDAASNRYVLSSPLGVTNDLVNGGISIASVSTFPFMIGSEIGGSGAASQSTAQNQVYQYMAARSHSLRFVGQ